MEIPRHWRFKKQRIAFKELKTNPVSLLGMKGAIEDSVARQNKSLEPIRNQIREEEEEEEKNNKISTTSVIVYSSSR